MNIPLEKWLVMAVLTAISIFLGLIPYILVRHTKSMLNTESAKYKVTLTVLSCFGGGVLFSTAMLHLFPELKESLQENPDVWNKLDAHFPLAEVIVIGGFCLIYLIEEVAHFIMVDGHHGHHHHMNTVARHNSVAHALPIPNVKGSGALSLTPRSSIITVTRVAALSQQAHSAPSICITSPSKIDSISIPNNTNNNELTVAGYPIEGRMSTVLEVDGDTQSLDMGLDMVDEECPDDKTNFVSSLRTFLALVALSFHAIIEGIAIGLQNSNSVWMMFGAVASHKFVISFCMGMELVATQTRRLTYFVSIIFFGILSPIGIIIGSALASDDSTKNLGVTLIEGVACGTLLYVVFFEILSRERERKSYSMSNSKAIGFIQFFALVVGLVGMGCLVTLTHDGHGSETDHDDDDDHGHSHGAGDQNHNYSLHYLGKQSAYF